jgi:outer membrane protein
MNKINFLFIVGFFALSLASSAQKTGYISMQQVVGLMPEVRKIDTLLQKYQSDSLNPQFTYYVSEYNRRDSMANGKDSLKMAPAARKIARQEMEGLAYQIQNWQQIVQNALQNKEGELLDPVYRKAMTALKTAAKENGYTYVYNREALLVAPEGDDLLMLVAKKLNLKVPATAATPKK